MMITGPQALAAAPTLSNAGDTRLLLAAALAIAAVVVLIVWAKFHPFIAPILGAARRPAGPARPSAPTRPGPDRRPS